MGQKMDPHGLRVGIIKDWNSKWYADSKDFGDYLVEDHKIRVYVKKKLYTAGISKIEIERTAKFVKVNVEECLNIAKTYSVSGLPSLLIFKSGEAVERMAGLMPKSTIISNIEKQL